jgi:dephospho-CoA kinase
MIIGIVGHLQVGKTTVANFIKEHNPDSILLSFADSLKEMIFNAGLCTKEELWGVKTPFSRLMMQKIGTEIIRKQVSENFWVNKMVNKIKNIPSDKLIIIHDVRFLNEYDMVRFFHGKMIRITRAGLDENSEENKHLSETEQDLIPSDVEIVNDGTIEDLKIKLSKVVLLFPMSDLIFPI